MPVFRTISDPPSRTRPPHGNWLTGAPLRESKLIYPIHSMKQGYDSARQLFDELHKKGYRDYDVGNYIYRTFRGPARRTMRRPPLPRELDPTSKTTNLVDFYLIILVIVISFIMVVLIPNLEHG